MKAFLLSRNLSLTNSIALLFEKETKNSFIIYFTYCKRRWKILVIESSLAVIQSNIMQIGLLSLVFSLLTLTLSQSISKTVHEEVWSL